MPQSVEELKHRAEEADLSHESTDEQVCNNCRFYQEMKEEIGYCAHQRIDMVVGGEWWCKLWAPIRQT